MNWNGIMNINTYISFSSCPWMTLAPLENVKSCLLHTIKTGGQILEIVLSLNTVYKYLKFKWNLYEIKSKIKHLHPQNQAEIAMLTCQCHWMCTDVSRQKKMHS